MGFFPHLQFAGRRFFRRARNQAMDLNRRDAVKFGQWIRPTGEQTCY
jgi:hypothetical protein